MSKPEELPERERKRRVASGRAILRSYLKRSGDKGLSRDEVLTDVLSNLMHYWGDHFKKYPNDATFTTIFERSADHTNIELGMDQEFDSFPHMIESDCDCEWNSTRTGPEHSEGCQYYADT